ncbi:hypothetical protein H4R34_004818 [Dimargaris verticillata]|uniref:Dolichyl-phosphate-mannose--protein mannosyltransferase n=1 Tax=Dimargaris verticillata TaxID=2761393 RepID=A0A9W8B3J7_9FUNG|nr:hypothetical protein H4R34_004818 [Dimargaris verticillata]
MVSSEKVRQRRQPVSIFSGHSSDDNEPILSQGLDRRKGKAPPSTGAGVFDDLSPSEEYELRHAQGVWRVLRPITKMQLIILAVVTLVAAYYRLWDLSNPARVVFDEVHFGKYAGKYINGTFFFDVHPPLAKMMFAATGKLAGYDGRFDFKNIGLDYLAAHVPYIGMRLMPAVLGLLTIPICYLTVKQSGYSTEAAVLGSILVTFENALITQSRLILLDSPLIFFTTFTILTWTNFGRHLHQPFTKWWWIWMTLSGVGMGLTLSCKWVGLFLVASVGVATLKQLWDLITDLNVSPVNFIRQFAARAMCLIVLPLAVYVFFFQIHFMVLSRNGSGSTFFSPEFQATLRGGNAVGATPRDVYYGGEVVLRHDATTKGLLHSHPHVYPDGSKQQQITLYPHRDDNNWWTITKAPPRKNTTKMTTETDVYGLEPVRHRDIVRLLHTKTDRRLHSHDLRGPLSQADYENEVSGYGWKGFAGDTNDDWRVEIIDYDSSIPESKTQLMALRTKFRLVHVNRDCALFSNEKKLPSWAFNQTEVICMKDAKPPKTLWRVESARHPDLPADAPKVTLKRPGLLSKVIESNQVMWKVNNGLTSTHAYESRPQHWPILRRGISFWTGDNRQIYLLGNPFIWWTSAVAVALFGVVQVVLHFADLRGCLGKTWSPVRTRYTQTAGFVCSAWFLHYAPFFLMDRQLFLHHYLPALYLAILALTFTLDTVTARVGRPARLLVFSVVALLALRYFYQFSNLTYGTLWTRAACKAAKWLPNWDFDCSRPPVELGAHNTTAVVKGSGGAAAATRSVAATTILSAAAGAPLQRRDNRRSSLQDVD